VLQLTDALMNGLLADAIKSQASGAYAGILSGVKIMLFVNSVSNTSTRTLADLTAATFDGYAASSPVTWLGPYKNDNGQQCIVASPELFQATDAVVPNVITGYGVFLSTTLLAYETWPQVVNINNALDGVVVNLTLPLPLTGYGANPPE
jgi:hypothetical protein